MKEIKFVAGYYEWHLIVDDKLAYVENDSFFDAIPSINGQILASDLEGSVSELVDYIRYRYIENTLEQIEDGQYDEVQVKELQDQIEVIKSLTDEEWQQVEKVIFKTYGWHYGVRDRRFEYKGFTFEPVGNILGGWSNRVRHTIYDNNYPTMTKFDYKDFYKVAKKNHASCDVYRINNSEDYYMLNGNIFRKVDLKDYSDFKTCDSYSKWYQ